MSVGFFYYDIADEKESQILDLRQVREKVEVGEIKAKRRTLPEVLLPEVRLQGTLQADQGLLLKNRKSGRRREL